MKRLVWYFLFIVTAATPLRGQDVPQWLRDTTAGTPPGFSPKTSAVVLLSEEKVSVEPDGRIVTTSHRVIRLLSREARSRAVARAIYHTDNGKVRALNAWLLRPSLPVKKFDTAVDIAAVNNDIYNEVRAKVISATDDADPGSTFAYESITEERSVFTQLDWSFQDDLPALISRVVLAMPPGWTASSLTFNHAPVEPVVSGSAYTWELRGLPPIEPEPSMPGPDQIVPRLVVTFTPPAASAAFGPSFDTWQGVSRWLTTLNEPQILSTPALSAEVQRLLTNTRSELDKIRAIGRFAQSIQYISIQTGLGRGGGYKPHTAGEIFMKAYGDCKDKVTVMRAMLKVAGITSYPVAIYSGDPYYVRESWPSPQQFNHAIIAISLSDSTSQPVASIQHPSLGRLLFFDPTDPDTLVGDLPEQLQESFALIVADDKGGLVRIPAIPPEKSGLRRQAEVVLLPDGSIEVKMHENSIGQVAAGMRAEFRSGSRVDFFKRIENWISQTVPAASVTNMDSVNQPQEDNFELSAEVRSPHYAQLMNNRLMVFKPVIVSRRTGFSFAETARNYPVVIHAQSVTDVVRIKLPEGFKVDDLPDAVKLETSFGRYAATFEVANGLMVFTRTLSTSPAVIPAARYAEVRSFFQRISAAEQAPVVLLKN